MSITTIERSVAAKPWYYLLDCDPGVAFAGFWVPIEQRESPKRPPVMIAGFEFEGPLPDDVPRAGIACDGEKILIWPHFTIWPPTEQRHLLSYVLTTYVLARPELYTDDPSRIDLDLWNDAVEILHPPQRVLLIGQRHVEANDCDISALTTVLETYEFLSKNRNRIKGKSTGCFSLKSAIPDAASCDILLERARLVTGFSKTIFQEYWSFGEPENEDAADGARAEALLGFGREPSSRDLLNLTAFVNAELPRETMPSTVRSFLGRITTERTEQAILALDNLISISDKTDLPVLQMVIPIVERMRRSGIDKQNPAALRSASLMTKYIAATKALYES